MSFSFGTPSSAPATTGLAGGFSFGANTSATPGLGLATSQPSAGLFGATPASSTTAFGATSTPTFGAAATPAFGATSTPGFGAASTPAFGASATPAFGAAATPAFGVTSSTALGATATPAFGATTAPTYSATTTPAFGATSTPLFGATTTTAFGATPAFGTPGLGSGGLNFGTGTNNAALSTGLQSSTAASSGAPGLWNFSTLSTAQNTNLLSGAKPGTTSLMGGQPSTSVSQSAGLGGMSSTAGGIGAANTTSTGDRKSEPPKQIKLPNEILTTVDSFKEFVKKQKSLSSDIMRVSIKPLQKVAKDAEELLRGVLSLSGAVGKARAQSRRLRGAGATALTAAETAARDMPYSEFDTFAPPGYVKELISELEQQLITLRRQMDVADKQMQASPRLLTEQELTLGIRRMHESLVALAGRLQNVHSQVEAQKEQYLNLRKYVLKDSTNVFETQSPTNSLDRLVRDAEGTKRKNKLGFTDGIGSAVLSDPRAVLGNIQQLAGPMPFSYVGSNLFNLSAVDAPGSAWQPQPTNQNVSFNTNSFGTFGAADTSNAFQLQKPPGKRTKQ